MARLKGLREGAPKLVLAGVVRGAEFRIAGGRCPMLEQQHHQRGLVCHQAGEALADPGGGCLVGRGCLGELHERARRFVDPLVEQREEEFLLILKVPVDRTAREPCPLCNRLQRRAGVATLDELVGCGVEHAFSGGPTQLRLSAVRAPGGHLGIAAPHA